VSRPLLALNEVTACYGVLPILHGVSLEIFPREIVALIGANGAGKTSLMMTIFGRPRASQGSIFFDGQNITGLPAHAIARLSIAQSPEGRRIFPRMTVLENLQMGSIIAHDASVFDQDLQQVCSLFPVLKSRRDQRAGTLSGGEQQMLAIARALMGRPKLLLLDEPSLGLAPLIVKQIFEVIKELNSQHGLTVFIVEQNAYHALKLADRGYVMVNGRITLSGSGAELLNSAEVQTAYLDGGRRKEPLGAAS
jgi:branched-chain amino acid transport system ATP-binding protein